MIVFISDFQSEAFLSLNRVIIMFYQRMVSIAWWFYCSVERIIVFAVDEKIIVCWKFMVFNINIGFWSRYSVVSFVSCLDNLLFALEHGS